MPCEACNIQFTVFKRKKSCTECRRLYCSNCLTKNKERILCKRCVIFTTRPLSKIELLKLKAKDLIFYLQSKHISTTGCVEKEELVNLVLIHVDNSANFSSNSQQQSPTAFSMGSADRDTDETNRSNPFDQIRNTCQNLFTTFTEKIAADFNFDFKQSPTSEDGRPCENQPRYSSNFRNVPSYNSNISMSNGSTTNPSNNDVKNNSQRKNQRPTTVTTSNQSQTQFESNAFNQHHNNNNNNNNSSSSGSKQNNNTQSSLSSPTGNSSSASTPSALKSVSSDERVQSIPVVQSPPPTMASTSMTRPSKPTLAKIKELTKIDCCNDSGSGCECSDDELIAKFRESYTSDQLSPSITTPLEKIFVSTDIIKSPDNLPIGPTTLSNSLIKTSSHNSSGDTAFKEEASALECSDISSFEDLGAVGGDLQSCNNIPCTSDSTDKWQIVNPRWNIDDTASTSSIVTTDDKINETNSGGMTASYTTTTNLPNSIKDLPHANNVNECENQSQRQQINDIMLNESATTFREPHSTINTENDQQTTELIAKVEKNLIKSRRQAHRKITRRQSDGIVYTASTSNPNHQHRTEQFLDDFDDGSSTSDDLSTSTHDKRSYRKSCRKCGKTKCGDLKKYIAKFRHQLETTTEFSEIEIKQQLDAFLEFLENQSKDDESNTEMMVQSPSQQFIGAEQNPMEDFDEDDDDEYDDEAGIHVYGSNDDDPTNTTHAPRQFFDLSTVDRKQELDELSVKQLKEVLMLNRVDFKGCCEKSELLERVQRLWDDLQNCPAVDKLPTVDLCKICMDAAIECVLLECGHMATCTNCGKVLSECPICRQYIVRVVRFFKA